MTFAERVAVIQDDEEWLNIPIVVRRLVRSLNEENEQNRALTEALRQEQRDTNLLLRRLIQKQTDMELDFSRSNLLLSSKPHLFSHDSAEKENKNRQVEAQTRKKLDRVSERVKSLEKEVEALNRSQSNTMIDEVTKNMLTTQDSLTASMRQAEDKLKVATETADARISHLEKTMSDAMHSLTECRAMCNQQTGLAQQVLSNVRTMEKSCEENKSNLKTLEGDLTTHSEALEKKHFLFDRRFAALQHAMEGVQGYLEAEKATAAAIQKETADINAGLIRDGLEKQRTDTQQLFLEIRQRYSDLERRFECDVREKSDSVCELTAKQVDTLRKIEEFIIPGVTDLSRKHDRLFSKIELLEDNLSDVRERSLRRGKDDVALFEAVAVEKRLHAESLKPIQEQIQQLGSSLVELRMTDARDRENARTDVEGLKVAMGSINAMCGRTDGQVTRLCEVARGLSEASQAAEKRIMRVEHFIEKKASQADQEPLAQVQPVDMLCKAVEDATKLIRDESAALRDSQQILTSQQDATAARVSQMERKLADVARSVDCVRQQPVPMATLPTWAEESLRELSPALVELEAMKRRIASVEAAREETRSGRQSDTRRKDELQLQVADSVEDTRRRLLELSRRVGAQEQEVAALMTRRGRSRKVRSFADSESEDSEADGASVTVRRLASNVTNVLEKLSMTEQTLMDMRAKAKEGLALLRERIDTVERDGRTRASSEKAAVEKLFSAQRQEGASALAALSARLAGTAADIAELKRAGHAGTQTIAELNNAVRSVQDDVRNQSREVARLFTMTNELEGKLTTHSTSAVEEQQRQNTEYERKHTVALGELADLRAQLTQQAELLQTQASTLAGITEKTVPALRDEFVQRVETAVEHLKSARENEIVSESQRFNDVVARLAVLDGRLSTVEGANQEALVTALHDKFTALVDRVQEHEKRFVQRPPSPSTDSAASPTTIQQQLHSLENDLKQYAYPRTELEERLENLWMSVVSLLARKDDSEAVNKKLDELRNLVQEETTIKLASLRGEVETTLADKVGLQELQDILENHAMEGEVSEVEDDTF